MNIFELKFYNGGVYEDRYYEYFYYETYKEAREAMDNFDHSKHYLEEGAELTIFELELGTQRRTRIFKKVLVPKKKQQVTKELQAVMMPDIEALQALRDKLAGISA